MLLFVSAPAFSLVYDDEPVITDPPVTDPPPVEKPAAKEEKNKPKFTPEQQNFMNSLIAEERRKATVKNDQLITQLETEKNRAGTTALEKQTLEERIETLRSEFATKDELKERETSKRVKELETKLQREEAERSTWKSKWERDKKNVDLTQAAASEKPYNSATVVMVLNPWTRLQEIVDDSGKGTGEFETKVKVPTKDKDGKPVVLDLDPLEAVKQLKEMPDYLNLFIDPAKGGLGLGNNNRGGGKLEKHQLGTADYIAERKKERATTVPRRSTR